VLGDTFRAAEPQQAKASAPLTPPPPESSAGDVSRLVGLYFGGNVQDVLHIRQPNGKLELGIRGSTRPLRAVGSDRFEAEGSPLSIAFEGEQLTLFRREESLGVFKRVQPVTLSADDWKPLVGAYYSPELDATWRIELKDGRAVLKGRALGIHPLEPVFADGFSTAPGFVRFSRDEAGQLTGFVFSELRFERK